MNRVHAFADDRRVAAAASWFARVALAAAFLSAVADRFGVWGGPGTEGGGVGGTWRITRRTSA